ncbi:hypothetical protein AA0116_g12902 [Alternaria tenuissima]|nr:hypothetical protein AA0116_g12902 [Alternaria tenuissima]
MDSESQKELNKALGTAAKNDKVTKVKALLKEGQKSTITPASSRPTDII